MRERPTLGRPATALPVGFGSPHRRPVQRDRRSGSAPQPSDLAKVFLDRDELWGRPVPEPPPRHVLVPRAEAIARDWAQHMFDAREARAWVHHNGDIAPRVAADLRVAGLTPEQAAVRIRTARGFLHKRSLAIRVSCGELTVTQAAAELREFIARTSRAAYPSGALS